MPSRALVCLSCQYDSEHTLAAGERASSLVFTSAFALRYAYSAGEFGTVEVDASQLPRAPFSSRQGQRTVHELAGWRSMSTRAAFAAEAARGRAWRCVVDSPPPQQLERIMPSFAHSPATLRLGDFEVPRLGFGAMQLPGPMVWGEPNDPARARAVLRRVVDLGIGLIDTSWYYGPHVANQLIAEVLHPYPKGLVIATKLGGKRTPDKGWAPAITPEELQRGCEEDLRTLRVDHVDLCHLRWLHQGEVSFSESLDAIIELQKRGKVRHIGLSNVTLAQLELALARTRIVSVQNLYNVAAGERRLLALPHAVVHEQEQLVDLCAKSGIAFLPFFPLAIPGRPKLDNAGLTEVAARHGKSETQIALAWLLARSPAILPIPGTSSPEHLEENWAAREVALSADEISRISRARA